MGEVTWLRRVTSLVRSCPEDTVLVTNDGRKITTWRLLLALHSPIMAQLFASSSFSSERLLAISVPFSAEQTNNLLADIEEGGDVVRGDQEVAELLGVRNSQLSKKITSKEISVQVNNPVENNSKVITKSPIKYPAGEVQNSFHENVGNIGDKTNINSVYNKSTNVSKGHKYCPEKTPRQTPLQSVLKQRTNLNAGLGSIKEIHLDHGFKNISGKTESIDREENESSEETVILNTNEVISGSIVVSLDNENKNITYVFEEIVDNVETNIHEVKTELNKLGKIFDDKCTLETGISIIKDDNVAECECKPLQKDLNTSMFLKTEDIMKGLTFPDHETMMMSINEWSTTNFSPIVTRSRVSDNLYMGCPHAFKKKSKSTGKRMRLDALKHAACPLKLLLRKRKDDSWVVSQAMMEHHGHEVSEEMFNKYTKTKLTKLSSDQEAAVMLLLSQGANMPEIGRMISSLTGREYSRTTVRVLAKQLRDRAGLDSQTGERLLE